jgi:hypothetical protein
MAIAGDWEVCRQEKYQDLVVPYASRSCRLDASHGHGLCWRRLQSDKTPARWQLAGVALGRHGSRSGVDLDQLCVGILDCVGGWHALDRLRIHVDDDVLGLHLGGLLVW